jgi:hypothetical protein
MLIAARVEPEFGAITNLLGYVLNNTGSVEVSGSIPLSSTNPNPARTRVSRGRSNVAFLLPETKVIWGGAGEAKGRLCRFRGLLYGTAV